MVSTQYINNNWVFYPQDHPEKRTHIRLPHNVKDIPFNYFDEREYQFVSVYEKQIFAPKEWEEFQVFLRFEGVGNACEVYLNDQKIGEHECGYTQFSVPLNSALQYGENNWIKVVVDSRETVDVPPFGHVIDYLTYGGIYREVALEFRGPVTLDRLFIKSGDVYSEAKTFEVKFNVNSEEALENVPVKADIRVWDGDSCITELCHETAKLGPNTFKFISDKVKSWDVEDPNVYSLTVDLYFQDEITDHEETTFGLRDAVFKRDGFYLNGKKLKLLGLDRHQSYPYVGYAMPESMQRDDARTLKYRLGLNAVRTSHYPQSKYFLDECDRLGLLVFTEAPGWQHIGTSDHWRNQHIQNVRDMILDDWNHPSIILWGVRINESLDDDELYTQANAVAHELDPTRQTSGVRYLKHSHLLEDVYAFNDFSHRGNNPGVTRKELVAPITKPYLISEHNGHMFPTKEYDCEEHRLSQALRHARVVNDALAPNNGISGVFGWCMADYNTHKDFGSGDRICYHGVMDMFRNPKLAAALYESQGDDHDVLVVSSSMDIGEHPGTWIGDVWAFTNADSVNLYKNDEFVMNFTPDTRHFPNLPHPPVLIDDLVGNLLEAKENLSPDSARLIRNAIKDYAHGGEQNVINAANLTALGVAAVKDKLTLTRAQELFQKYSNTWGADVTEYRFEAIRGGEVVKTVDCSPAMEFHLETEVSSYELVEKTTYDVAAVRIRAVSEKGNLLVYANDPVVLHTEGNLELIGPDIIPLRGGYAGTYVRSTGSEGTGKLILHTPRCNDITLTFETKIQENE